MAFEKEKSKTKHSQLRLLVWKNFTLQKRSLIGTILELTIPAIFAIILLPIRTIVKSSQLSNDTTYNSFQVDQFDEFILSNNFSKFGYFPNNSQNVRNLVKKLSEKINLEPERKFF